MRSILVTGSDTGVGKTWVVAQIARALVARGDRVQIVKVIETGVAPGQPGDAAWAAGAAGGAEAVTLFSYRAALAPASAAALEGRRVDWAEVVAAARNLEPLRASGAVGDAEAPAWRIFEGAGGIASPIDAEGHDWADFAAALGIERTVIVVPERLGAINHARLCAAHAAARNLTAGIWLNAMVPVPAEVSASIRTMLPSLRIALWSQEEVGGRSGALGGFVPNPQPLGQAGISLPFAKSSISDDSHTRTSGKAEAHAAADESDSALLLANQPTPRALFDRWSLALSERDQRSQRRRIRVTPLANPGVLNLSDNDYLDLAHDPAVIAAARAAAERYGTSAAASPLITGWKEPHEALVQTLCAWHGFPCGMLWTSGYAANCAVLGTLPEKGDLILADRLIHHSMIAGLGRSGARFKRYPHLDLDRLELEFKPGAPGLSAEALAKAEERAPPTFLVTESVFSMDGDYPDLQRLAALKREHNFLLILDEAHALGWYGPAGAGLAAAAGVAACVDVFVGTLGKALASGGAYTLFRDEVIRDMLINRAGEFIYSTGIPPAAAAAADAAIGRIRELSRDQSQWQDQSRTFRRALQTAGWSAPDGDSPIVPMLLDTEEAALELAATLREAGIWAAAVRPPTVPAGTSRLRFSLKRGFGPAVAERVLAAMAEWRRTPRAPIAR